MDLFDKCKKFTLPNEIKALNCYPYFHFLNTKQDTVVEMEGRREIMLGSNNYLGLTSNPEVIEAGVEAIKNFGSGVSGSRFLNGTMCLHLELEKNLAEFLNKEAVMTFSTGFQSNLGIISAIAERHDIIFCDRENHASIYDGCRLSYADMQRFHHNDMEELEELLKSAPANAGKLIVTDGVFSMSGDIANLPVICKLARQYGARVMVDDAHGFGVLGEHGRGTAEYWHLEDQVDIIMGTFSKSLASLGGFMASTKEVVDFVMHKSRPYIFAAALAPANVACANAALNIIRRSNERTKNVLEIAAYVRKGLKERGLAIMENSCVPIIPIYTYGLYRTMVACKLLFERGVYVNPVVPPAAPEGKCLIRTAYCATHTKEVMDEAMDMIADVLNNLPESDEEILALIKEGKLLKE